NIVKDFRWIAEHVKEAGGDAAAVNTSSRYALLALQGPAARDVLQSLTGVNLGAIKYYWFATGEVANVKATISRTGYTGEDGFEVFAPPSAAERVWDAMLQAGEGAGVVPAGLGARDTLRLEAAMRLYGKDRDDTTTVLEADVGRIVGWTKEEMSGGAARRRSGLPRMSARGTGEQAMYPPELKYTNDHEWIRLSGSNAKIGITDYAQKQLGDVVYLELPEVGRTFKKGDVFGTIE